MKGALSLAELKALVHTHTQKEYLACPSVISGIPRGAITEISGNGKTLFVANLLLEHKDLKVAWIEDQFSVNPFGLQQKKIKPEKIVFVEASGQMEWATLIALRSQHFPIVVIYGEFKDLKALRRIQLASEKANAATLWLTPKPQTSWTSSMRLKISKQTDSKDLDVTILKSR